MAAFNSASEKNCSFRKAAVIQVDILPTEPSTFGLSLLSVITDNKDYRRKNVISNLSPEQRIHDSSRLRLLRMFSDNKSAQTAILKEIVFFVSPVFLGQSDYLSCRILNG